MTRKKKIDLSNPSRLRLKAGETQAIFWARFGCTQSAGSRYESGRELPKPLQLLMKANLAGALSTEQLIELAKR